MREEKNHKCSFKLEWWSWSSAVDNTVWNHWAWFTLILVFSLRKKEILSRAGGTFIMR